MERDAKRKAAAGAAAENETRPSKRQKASGDAAGTTDFGETPETTTSAGLKFLESLRGAKDKTGRPISTHFLTLPDKDEIPEYYETVKLPIAIDTMEDKLNRGEYATLAQLESDCKRLVNNAKLFNDKKSIIYEDAERLRKTASNWMTKNNPAYKIRGYTAVATPVPGEDGQPTPKPPSRPVAATPRPSTRTVAPTPDTTAPSTVTATRPRRAAAPESTTPAPSRRRKSVSAAPAQHSGAQAYEGKTFQQAQDQIITELIEYVDPKSELQIFFPFVHLPSRSIKDYYQLIKNPMSLSGVRKKVQGVVGRNPPTGITELKSWNAFEEAVSWIWKNARHYNEDGSDLYNLSIEFEEMFKRKLADAKAKVEEPPQPKLKLNMSSAPKQQLKIKLRQSPSSESNTPGGRSSATPGVLVDNEALLRQQRHVHESMNGKKSSRPSSSSGKQQTPLTSATPFNGPRAISSSTAPVQGAPVQAASPAVANGIKHDVQSPALNSIRPASVVPDNQTQRVSVPAQTPHPVMPPPQGSSRPLSGSPLPNGNGPIGQQTGNYPQYHPPPNYYVPPAAPNFGTLRKVPLKSASEALIPRITISTAPSLNLPKPFSITIPANKEKTSQSITINLPASHSHLHVVPFLPVALDGRPYRSFYHLNGKKYSETPRVHVTPGIDPRAPGYEGGRKKGEPLYDAKLLPGVNRIEIEVVAERDMRGKPEPKDPKDALEVEKCTIFVNLMRS